MLRRWFSRRASFALIASVAIGATACGCAATIVLVQGLPVHLSETSVRLHNNTLIVHLASGTPAHAAGPLLIYATGDAGWWGQDKALYRVLVDWGYPVAGFSARNYVHHLGPGTEVERPTQLAEDYAAIIAGAERMLELPAETTVVLVGKSRGAGLEVAAASTPRLRPELKGVLAIGLTREEEYIERRLPGAPRNRPRVMLQTYDVLPQIGGIPVAVIQSSRDNYLPAALARTLFGDDTPARRFSAIDASNHNFGGAVPTLYEEMARSFEWIVRR